jgi:hypothetical protein
VSLQARPGFDWNLVNWGAPDELVTDECSVCEASIPEDSVPLRLWNNEGWAAVFCDGCPEAIFGVRTLPPEDCGGGPDD